jgi:DNA-binding NarL/FixJ family response regulator
MGHLLNAQRPSWTVRFAEGAAEARAVLAKHAVDLVIIDVGLLEEDGFALLDGLAREHPGLRQMLISGRNDAAVRVRARACGARGFVAKTMSSDAILDAVDAVLAGGTAFDEVKARPAGERQLTSRQAEILELVAQGHGNKEIRHRLGIAERTVRAHLTELFVTLDAHSRTQALIRARDLGMIE